MYHRQKIMVMLMLILFVILLLPSDLGIATEKPLTNDDIVSLVKAGLDDSVIISLIQRSTTQFDLTPHALIELKQAGVSDAIIAAMVKTSTPPVSSVETSKKASVGWVVVKSEVQEAEVYVGDDYLGKPNEELAIPAGDHKLRVVHGDFAIEKNIKVKQGEKQLIKVSFPGQLHIIYTFTKADIYESSLDISIEGNEARVLKIATKKTSRGLFDFTAPEEVTKEKKILLKPGRYKMSVVYTWDGSLHRYSRKYEFSIYPAETTLFKTRMDTAGGSFFTTGISTEIFEKGKKVFEGN